MGFIFLKYLELYSLYDVYFHCITVIYLYDHLLTCIAGPSCVCGVSFKVNSKWFYVKYVSSLRYTWRYLEKYINLLVSRQLSLRRTPSPSVRLRETSVL